jgi:hypothetical protein
MIRPLIAALTLVLVLVAPVAAQTSRVQLTDQTWVDLGAAPFTVRTLGSPAAIVIDTAPPSGLNVPFTVLGSEEQRGLSVTVSGTHAYARALNAATAVATFPASVASSGSGTSPTTTTSGALQPPTAAAGKTVATAVSVSATTSTQLVAANANRIAYQIQCASGGVSVDETGAALTGASVANGTVFIPAGTTTPYIPPIASLTAITAYTATAQSCRVTETLR